MTPPPFSVAELPTGTLASAAAKIKHMKTKLTAMHKFINEDKWDDLSNLINKLVDTMSNHENDINSLKTIVENFR